MKILVSIKSGSIFAALPHCISLRFNCLTTISNCVTTVVMLVFFHQHHCDVITLRRNLKDSQTIMKIFCKSKQICFLSKFGSLIPIWTISGPYDVIIKSYGLGILKVIARIHTSAYNSNFEYFDEILKKNVVLDFLPALKIQKSCDDRHLYLFVNVYLLLWSILKCKCFFNN